MPKAYDKLGRDFGNGSDMVGRWFASGSQMVRTWFANGSDVVRVRMWFGCGSSHHERTTSHQETILCVVPGGSGRVPRPTANRAGYKQVHTSVQNILMLVVSDRPTDRPTTDRPMDRPRRADRPTNRPADRPVGRFADSMISNR